MTSKRTGWVLSLGLLVAVACGKATVLPEPTTILVKVHLVASQNITQLFVTGTVNGFEEFPHAYLPDAGTAPFNGPQSFRIFLADSEAGKQVEIDVFGINAAGDPVAAGTQTVTVVKQQEVLAEIDLTPNATSTGGGAGGGTGGGAGGGAGGGTGGGSGGTGGGTAGGAGGGTGGGTGGAGGGMGGCSCDGGACCLPDSAVCAMPKTVTLQRLMVNGNPASFVATDCGAANQTCTGLCDPLRGFCVQGACRCGTAGVCEPGQRCVVTGSAGNLNFECRCDPASLCNGCCDSSGQCTRPSDEDASACGLAGYSCDTCTSSGGTATCNGGTCGQSNLTCAAGKCLTGAGCAAVTFPTCIAPLNDRCTACDPLRADHCNRVVGVTTDGCACGMRAECDSGNYCDDNGTCQPLK